MVRVLHSDLPTGSNITTAQNTCSESEGTLAVECSRTVGGGAATVINRVFRSYCHIV